MFIEARVLYLNREMFIQCLEACHRHLRMHSKSNNSQTCSRGL